MILASIDLGTNSIILTVAAWNGRTLTPLAEEIRIVRLGQDLRPGSNLHPDAQRRCLEALEHFSQRIGELGVETILAAGTAALRNAADGHQFVEQVQARFDIRFQIITGEDEARLTFKAIQHDFADVGKEFLMIDIGGGSTELVMGDCEQISSTTSLNAGTVLFTEQYVLHDPPLRDELEAAETAVKDLMVQSLPTPFSGIAVGVAGTVTTLKAVDLQMDEYEHSAVHRSRLSREDVVRLGTLLGSMPTTERVKLKGLPPKRADIIPVGATILETLMERMGLESLWVSDRGLRWGLLYDWTEKNG